MKILDEIGSPLIRKQMYLPSGMQIPEDQVARLCRKWGIAKLEVFGSALTSHFTPESDIDLLATFDDTARRGLDFYNAAADFGSILSRKIDLVSKKDLMQSRNQYRSRKILASAVVLYDGT